MLDRIKVRCYYNEVPRHAAGETRTEHLSGGASQAALAQVVAHLIGSEEVTGSIPVASLI